MPLACALKNGYRVSFVIRALIAKGTSAFPELFLLAKMMIRGDLNFTVF